MTVHLLNAGKFGPRAGYWAARYPALKTSIAYQIDAGSDGGVGRAADLDAIDWHHHYWATAHKMRQNPVMYGHDGDLVVFNWENNAHPQWQAIKTGSFDETFLHSNRHWMRFCAELLPFKPMRGWYLWPYRCMPNWTENINAAGEAAEWFFTECVDCIMPSIYNKEPGDPVRDAVTLRTALETGKALADRLGKPLIPQTQIKHVDGGMVDADEFRRDMLAVREFTEHVALWSDGRLLGVAEAVSDMMVSGGYADVLVEVFS